MPRQVLSGLKACSFSYRWCTDLLLRWLVTSLALFVAAWRKGNVAVRGLTLARAEAKTTPKSMWQVAGRFASSHFVVSVLHLIG